MISVIIPTYNRSDILKLCLERLSQQEGVEFEVIVVDDGSTDETKMVLSKLQKGNAKQQSQRDFSASVEMTKGGVEMTKGRLGMKRLHYIHQVNSGQGVARNRGVKEAKGDIILFIGDDILVEPDFLKNHQKTHDLYPDVTVAVLGHSTWDPALQINDYMRFLESSGWQFGYEFLTPGFVKHSQPYKFFYTSNISLKKELFEKEQFDEQFRSYGWEDIEWAFRLWKKHGLKVFYEPKAKAYHHHFIPESDLPKRMQKVGQSAVLCQKLQPEIQIMPTGLKAYLIKLATNPITLPLTRLLGKNTYFKFCSWREFFVGMKG